MLQNDAQHKNALPKFFVNSNVLFALLFSIQRTATARPGSSDVLTIWNASCGGPLIALAISTTPRGILRLRAW